MSGKSKEVDDENHEHLMLLRLPEKYAKIVHKAVDKGNLRERLLVDLKDDCRNALVKVDDEILVGKIVDLPCVVECQKTIDNKIFYKSGDICQMLLVSEEPLDEEAAKQNQMQRKEKLDLKKFIYPHGITLPLKNVRKKRFRKTAPKKIIDDPEVEKEVRRLLKADLSAVEVWTETKFDETQLLNSSQTKNLSDAMDLSKLVDDTIIANPGDEGLVSQELMDVFQDLSSEEEEDEDEPLFGGSSSSGIEKMKVSSSLLKPELKDDIIKKELLKEIKPMVDTSWSQDAYHELESLDRRIHGLEVEIGRTTNSFLRSRLQADLDKLKQSKNEFLKK